MGVPGEAAELSHISQGMQSSCGGCLMRRQGLLGGHTEEPGLWVGVEAWNRTGEGAGGASLEKSQLGIMGTPSMAALGCE